jgi:geranylgeranyl transferase type-1 subunit beta
MYHSFLGMMVLAMFGEPGLQNVDSALCITERAKKHLESLPWRREAIASIKSNGVDGAGHKGISQVAADRMQIDS